jgi:DNA-directed RNA polymerase subunit RPC12/RpoP
MERPGDGYETIRSIDAVPRRDARSGSLTPRVNEHYGLAAAGNWRSDLALLAALRVGVDDSTGRAEPTESSIPWLFRPDGDGAPQELRLGDPDVSPGTLDDGVFRAGQRLLPITRGYQPDPVSIVAGDTATDFALALAYDRLLGRAIWLPSSVVEPGSASWQEARRAVQRLIRDRQHHGGAIPLTSSSVSDEGLESLAERLREPEFRATWISQDGEEIPDSPAEETVAVRRPDLASGLSEFVADEHVGASVFFPVVATPEGFEEAPLGLETPIPTRLLFAEETGLVPYWYVDVQVAERATPTGRDLPSTALMVRDRPFPEVNIRSGRNGVSFSPHSQGFVPGGALLTSRLGRPRLRIPNMTAWVRMMAAQSGLHVRLSDAGRRAELVAARLGSRSQLLDLMSPSNLGLLKEFVRLDRPPRERDPGTVVIGVDPYLSIDAIAACLGDQARDLVDQLVRQRLLRRGLALDCAECGRLSFVDADRVGQEFECPQCSSSNALVSDRWKRSAGEPRWFYDLYTPLRELLGAHGDVPLLASNRLRGASRSFADAPELEFVDAETGIAVAEVDVIAYADGEVVVGEAKSNGTFGARKIRAGRSAKLLRIAEALRADRLLLATSKSEWSPADIAHLSEAARRLTPFAPEVTVVCDLGAATDLLEPSTRDDHIGPSPASSAS